VLLAVDAVATVGVGLVVLVSIGLIIGARKVSDGIINTVTLPLEGTYIRITLLGRPFQVRPRE